MLVKSLYTKCLIAPPGSANRQLALFAPPAMYLVLKCPFIALIIPQDEVRPGLEVKFLFKLALWASTAKFPFDLTKILLALMTRL